MPRTSWQVMSDSIYALFFRELKTRFGSKRMGYFWAVAEPALSTMVMATLLSVAGRRSFYGIPVMLFMLTGFISFGLYSKLSSSISNAISANKGLLGYRQVAPIDPVITRFIIEFLTTLIVFVILVAFIGWLSVDLLDWMRIDVIPQNFIGILSSLALLAILSASLGLIVAIATVHWDGAEKVYSIATRPMMILSGVFFPITVIPEKYWYLLSWNPVLHAIELVRDSYFYAYTTPVGSWIYLGGLAFGFLLLSLMLYNTNRHRLVFI